mgnify:CR=1 FL=1
MKKTYQCKGIRGRPFIRSTERIYTHAIVEFDRSGQPLRAISFCGNLNLAEKKLAAERKYLFGTTAAIVEVVEI